MKQVWLRTNRRVLLVPVAVFAILEVVGFVAVFDPWDVGWAMRGPGIALIVLANFAILAAIILARQPRIAYADGNVLFYIRLGRPVAIPIEVVECFLMGEGPVLLPGERYAKTVASTVVARLAERAEEWQHGDFHPLLAAWCDGYVTIRGTWCEPLSVDVVHRLNRLLYDASRAAA
jgi:hypothetical protein